VQPFVRLLARRFAASGRGGIAGQRWVTAIAASAACITASKAGSRVPVPRSTTITEWNRDSTARMSR
jgi:hypothetical protein